MNKIIPTTALVLSLIASNALAAVEVTKKDFDPDTRYISVEGSAGSEQGTFTVFMPKAGTELANVTGNDDILYAKQLKSNADGSFTLGITLPNGAPDAVYDIFFTSVGGNPTAVKVSAVSKATYEDAIKNLNEKAKISQTEFEKAFKEEAWKCGFNNETAPKGSDVLIKMMFNYAKDKGFSLTDKTANSNVYSKALAAQFLKEKNSDEADKLIKAATFERESLSADYILYTNGNKNAFMNKLVSSETVAGFETSLTDAMLLSYVAKADGASEVKGILEKYAEYIGINTDKATLSDYSALAGKDYATVKALKAAFGGSGSGNSGGTSGGTSGGSSSSSSSSSGSTGISGSSSIGGASMTPTTINIKFDDLNSVPWAYTAISKLFEKNIISGVSETKFMPNESITREAFVKMLVSISGITADGTENIFADVTSDKWYAKYVNSAYNSKIASGISEKEFGVGRELSREDMCVMAYNFLKKMNVDIKSAELDFADAAEFGEYSKAAVGALSGMGVVNGVGDNRFDPKGTATRAQAAVIVNNLLGLIK